MEVYQRINDELRDRKLFFKKEEESLLMGYVKTTEINLLNPPGKSEGICGRNFFLNKKHSNSITVEIPNFFNDKNQNDKKEGEMRKCEEKKANLNLKSCLNGKFILLNRNKIQTIDINLVGRYVRYRPSKDLGDGIINPSQIIINDINNVNIAYNKPVFATSTFFSSSRPSSIVDGTTILRSSHWASNNGREDFIEIDLGQNYYISSIRVLQNSGCCDPGGSYSGPNNINIDNSMFYSQKLDRKEAIDLTRHLCYWLSS
jgi:hypothetical protein